MPLYDRVELEDLRLRAEALATRKDSRSFQERESILQELAACGWSSTGPADSDVEHSKEPALS